MQKHLFVKGISWVHQENQGKTQHSQPGVTSRLLAAKSTRQGTQLPVAHTQEPRGQKLILAEEGAQTALPLTPVNPSSGYQNLWLQSLCLPPTCPHPLLFWSPTVLSTRCLEGSIKILNPIICTPYSLSSTKHHFPQRKVKS